MPFIRTAINVDLPKEKEQIIKEKLGKAIALIPGKSERSLMLEFAPNSSLYFAGVNSEPIAFVEVKLFGASTKEAYNKLTAEICSVLEQELAINPSNTYVKYEEVLNWGCNGRNF